MSLRQWLARKLEPEPDGRMSRVYVFAIGAIFGMWFLWTVNGCEDRYSNPHKYGPTRYSR